MDNRNNYKKEKTQHERFPCVQKKALAPVVNPLLAIRVLVIRNGKLLSPFEPNVTWSDNCKCISCRNGLWAYEVKDFETINSNFMIERLWMGESYVFYLLEIDENNIVSRKGELVFTEANIIFRGNYFDFFTNSLRELKKYYRTKGISPGIVVDYERFFVHQNNCEFVILNSNHFVNRKDFMKFVLYKNILRNMDLMAVSDKLKERFLMKLSKEMTKIRKFVYNGKLVESSFTIGDYPCLPTVETTSSDGRMLFIPSY